VPLLTFAVRSAIFEYSFIIFTGLPFFNNNTKLQIKVSSMKKVLLICLLGLFSFQFSFAQLQSPKEFLGYGLGEKFTRHHTVVSYFQHLAAEQKHIQLQEYGKTYEDRPLMVAVISSPENMANITQIREDNLRRAGLLEGTPSTNIPIVWLSYNVHGNEAVSTEASMGTAYQLLTEKKEWLKNVVVIIDPCINPDGRDRYVNFYWQHGNQPYNPDPQGWELNEPWPGGRANHYLFDLNRDWAWQTQIESQSRIKIFNSWLPQIHVDFHEQGVNNPYYFAPAAEPLHELITPWQREFQVEIGKNNARYMDAANRFYFTKQRFDLLYPSYGDTYPTYNGAIGMTYEQGGGGRGGLGVINQEGATLTLVERIENHTMTGLSTVEVSVKNGAKLTEEFGKFYQKGKNNPTGTYKAFVIKNNNQNDRTQKLLTWLDIQGIQYTVAGAATKAISGYSYATGKNASFTVNAGDIVVNSAQPKSVLAQVLLEPKTKVVDSLTYDITAWSIPYAYGLEAFASTTAIPVSKGSFTAPVISNVVKEGNYAYLLPWKDMRDATFLADILKQKIKARFTSEPITVDGKTFERGTLIISKRDNPTDASFEKTLMATANAHSRQLTAISSGFVDKGPDIGSSDIYYLKTPKIALLGGSGTSSLDFGATWHFMEQELKYPVTVLGTPYFSRVDLAEYDVLIVQNQWSSALSEGDVKKIQSWVTEGGRLILVQNAISMFEKATIGGIRKYNNSDEEKIFKDRTEAITKANQLLPYADQERENIKGEVPGAIFRVTLDNTHPLAFGYSKEYFSLKTDNIRYAYLEKGINVGTIQSKNDLVAGFAGQYVRDAAPQSMVFGSERMGSGTVTYFVDNPLFRSFWENGKLMFCNALFFVGQ
jgi:hypothetical protein